MKKLLSLLLILLLLTGCGESAPPETTAAPTVMPTETESPYPPFLETEISVEGTPQKLVLDLFDGGSYVVYIPRDDFTLTTSLENGALTDCWTCVHLDTISFRVVSFGPLSEAEAEQRILEAFPQYTFDDYGEDVRSGMDFENWMFLELLVKSDGKNTFALVGEYPMDAGDGYAPRIGKIMDSFVIK